VGIKTFELFDKDLKRPKKSRETVPLFYFLVNFYFFISLIHKKKEEEERLEAEAEDDGEDQDFILNKIGKKAHTFCAHLKGLSHEILVYFFDLIEKI
jgi:hypothetical protein